MEKLRVGVVGAGAISDIYLQNMTSVFSNLEVVSICAAHLERAKKQAEKYHLRAYTFEEMLADPEVDLVVNLTPVGVHYELVKKALESGKHVYTEKTIADDPDKARELCALADEKGLYLGCAPDTFLGAALQTARDAIDKGLLGEIHSFAISSTRNNNLLLSALPFLRMPGTGILYDYAVYYVTALVSLLGPVEMAGGIIGHPYKTHTVMLPDKPDFGEEFDYPNESQVSAILKLKNGITGTLHMDADSLSDDEAYFTIYGTKGALKLTDPNWFGGTVYFTPVRMDWRNPESVALEPVSKYSENSRGLGVSDMADAILNKRRNRANKEMACHVLDVLDAILKCGEEGGFAKIPSECEIPEAFAVK